jgi:hypothetical protein
MHATSAMYCTALHLIQASTMSTASPEFRTLARPQRLHTPAHLRMLPSSHPTCVCAAPAASTPYKELLPQWEAAGVKVINVQSEAKQGYVQDVFGKATGITDPAAVGVLLCGQKEMCNEVKALLEAAGVEADKVLLNF